MASTQTSASFHAVSLVEDRVVDFQRGQYKIGKDETIKDAWRLCKAHYAALGYTGQVASNEETLSVLFERENDSAHVYVSVIKRGVPACKKCGVPHARTGKPTWCDCSLVEPVQIVDSADIEELFA